MRTEHALSTTTTTTTTTFVFAHSLLISSTFTQLLYISNSVIFMQGRGYTPAPPNGPAPSYSPSRAPQNSVAAPKIGIVVATGVGSDMVLEEAVNSLKRAGYNDITTVQVADCMMLPYTAQSMFPQFHLVMALCLVTNDALGSGSLTQTLVGALLQVAVQAGQPVVSGIFCPGSLLEAKVQIPDLTKKWVETVSGFMAARFGVIPMPPAPVRPQAVVITPAVKDVNTLLEDFRQTLRDRGTVEIFQFGKKFAIIDDDNSGSINLPEFSKMLKEHRLSWTNEQIKLVFDAFDDDHSGTISYEEFLFHVRGEMNDRRKQMVLMAFEVFDKDKSGCVDINDLRGVYKTDKHPDVIAGKKTADEALTEFLYTFDKSRDGQVTPPEFLDYYHHVSVSIDNDDYFELMIRNAWHISGGKGWCENTTCRRVLVTHQDGRQTVEEIKNDIGLDKTDKAGMIQRLIRQGITDLVDIDLSGSTDDTTAAINPGGGPKRKKILTQSTNAIGTSASTAGPGRGAGPTSPRGEVRPGERVERAPVSGKRNVSNHNRGSNIFG